MTVDPKSGARDAASDPVRAARDTRQARLGRRAALLMAGTGLFWIAAMFLGSQLDWPDRTRALFDLIALAGFGLSLWMTYMAGKAGRDQT
jgi:uncharacterized membrane protein